MALLVSLGAALGAVPAYGQVVLHPNQVRGVLELTNTNPDVLGILNGPGDVPPGLERGLAGVIVYGNSLPPRNLQHSTYATTTNRLRAPYELTVESGPPGDGIPYWITPQARLEYGYFILPTVTTGPIEEEPAPDTIVDFSTCVSIVRLRFQDAGGAPSPISGGSAVAYSSADPNQYLASVDLRPFATEDYLVLPGDGLQHRIWVRLTVGTDVFRDRLNYEIAATVEAKCDEIVDLPLFCSTGGGPGDPLLSEVTGVMDMVGELEHRLYTWSLVQMDSGPWMNGRSATILQSPSSGAFTLINVMPSDVVSPAVPYKLAGFMMFRSGRRFANYESPSFQLNVPRASTVALGDRLVIDPGTFQGDIRLAGPKVTQPAIGSPLEDIFRESDRDSNGDGVPDSPFLGTGDGSTVFTRGPYSGTATAIFAGDFVPAQDDFLGNYELVTGGLGGQPSMWGGPQLQLGFRDRRRPSVPESYRDSTCTMNPALPPTRIEAGTVATSPLHFCMSELQVGFYSPSVTLTRPSIVGLGSFQGTDFEQTVTSYQIYLEGDGTPNSGSAPEGLVVLDMPQGTYDLHPYVTANNPGGGTSQMTLETIQIQVGCRQRIRAWNDFHLALVAIPATTTEPEIDITGRVEGTATIEEVAWSLDGGPPNVVCSACGVAPTFLEKVPLPPGPHELEVTARDSLGHVSSVSAPVYRCEQPGDLGNVLRGTKQAGDVSFRWSPWPGSIESEVLRDSSRPFPAPVSVATVPMPGADARDVGALAPATGPLLFYRVRAISCLGLTGP